MKFKVFIILVILGMVSVMPMIYTGKFDLMAFFESSASQSSAQYNQLKSKVSGNLSGIVKDEKVQVYQWRDNNGVMQFSNMPPPDVSHAKRIMIDPNNNLVSAIKRPKKEEVTQEQARVVVGTPNPYSVKGMKKVMNDARGIEQMLKKQHEQQQKMLKDL